MVLAGVYAARRHQSHQMAGFAARFQLFNQIGQNRVFFNAAVFDCHVNTGQVLHNDASGTQIHVADFGVAHLTVRQADGKSGSFNQAMRTFFNKPVPIRRLAVFDGIVRGNRSSVTPTVQNQKHYGFLCHYFLSFN